jgi:uncharacterized protein (DUF927 family)
MIKKRSTNPKSWLRFTHTLKSMYNETDTYTKKDREWKNIMIALNEMPLMNAKEL